MKAGFLNNPDELRQNTPFIIPLMQYRFEKNSFLNLFQLILKSLPKKAQDFLILNSTDPYFMEMRKIAGDSKSHPRTKRLVLLYQCLQYCNDETMLAAICAISLITGLTPKIIADHNMLEINPSDLVILEALHHKANKKINGPIYSFSGRVEVHKVTEALPPTFLWTLQSNSYSNIQLPSFFTSINTPKPPVEPLLANQFPPHLTYQQQWILFSPAQRKLMPKPFFYTPDLSDGFNVKHGIPPVPCFNAVDDQRPPLIQWIADLEIPESIPLIYNQCHCQSHHCLDCHVLTFSDGLKTMKYNVNNYIPEIPESSPPRTSCACRRGRRGGQDFCQQL